MIPPVPKPWRAALGPAEAAPSFQRLRQFLEEEYRTATVYPPAPEIFSALEHTPPERASVLILGQDPYHGAGQAHGMAFSVRPGVPPPPSLANMFRELRDDLGCRVPNNGYLVPWADQGVLLLNAVLTVREAEPNSHKGKGWEQLTDAVIHALSDRPEPVVFVLWGAYARKKAALIDTARHTVIESAHPSPLSARSGFFGSRPFSKINAALRAAGRPEVDWQLPDR